MKLKSNVEGVQWPYIQVGYAATLMALQRQFEETQWLTTEHLIENQFIKNLFKKDSKLYIYILSLRPTINKIITNTHYNVHWKSKIFQSAKRFRLYS